MEAGDIASVLLPAARVDVYALNDDTAAKSQNLASDWRFARISMNVQRSTIDTAIDHYKKEESPELVIIETDDISDAFVQKLSALAEACAAGTDAVVIGPTNDVHLYRSLVGMGVRDYLVRPVSDLDMASVIAKSITDKKGLSGARLIAVAGGKGGVGATAVAQLLASIIADKLDQKTMLMDVAGSNSTLGVSFGMEPSVSFSEAVRVGLSGSEDDMKRIIQSAGKNLSILVCGGEPMLNARPDPESVEALVSRLMQRYPVVVMDLSGASRAVQRRLVALASAIVVVTTPLLTALRNTRTYVNDIKTTRSDLKDVELLINMQGQAGSEEVSEKDIETALELKPAAKIPYVPKVFVASESAGKPVIQNAAAASLVASLISLAGRVTGVIPKGDLLDTAKKGKAAGLFKKIKGGKE